MEPLVPSNVAIKTVSPSSLTERAETVPSGTPAKRAASTGNCDRLVNVETVLLDSLKKAAAEPVGLSAKRLIPGTPEFAGCCLAHAVIRRSKGEVTIRSEQSDSF